MVLAVPVEEGVSHHRAAKGLFRGQLERHCTRGWPFRIMTFFQELVEFYQQNSLKDCFKSLDTTLQFPYKEPERRAINKAPGRRMPLQAGGLHSSTFLLLV